jgi:hypothetical protein
MTVTSTGGQRKAALTDDDIAQQAGCTGRGDELQFTYPASLAPRQ